MIDAITVNVSAGVTLAVAAMYVDEARNEIPFVFIVDSTQDIGELYLPLPYGMPTYTAIWMLENGTADGGTTNLTELYQELGQYNDVDPETLDIVYALEGVCDVWDVHMGHPNAEVTLIVPEGLDPNGEQFEFANSEGYWA